MASCRRVFARSCRDAATIWQAMGFISDQLLSNWDRFGPTSLYQNHHINRDDGDSHRDQTRVVEARAVSLHPPSREEGAK